MKRLKTGGIANFAGSGEFEMEFVTHPMLEEVSYVIKLILEEIERKCAAPTALPFVDWLPSPYALG